MRNHTIRRVLFGVSVLLVGTLSAFATRPAATQTAGKIACERAYDSCSEECVHLGVITARCFNRCKRSYRLCSVRQLVLPSRPRTPPATQPAAAQTPIPRSMDSVQ
jgi:hypothetical protein